MTPKKSRKEKYAKKYWTLFNMLRGELSRDQTLEIILTYLSAKIIDEYYKDDLFVKEFVSIGEINDYLRSKDKSPLICDISLSNISESSQERIYRYIKENDLVKMVDYFLFKPLSGHRYQGQIFNSIIMDLADLFDFSEFNKIADINCKGSSILLQALSSSEFDGEVHLYSPNSIDLKMSFLDLFNEHKNIILHKTIFSNNPSLDEKFDFIMLNSSFGGRDRNRNRSLISGSHRMEIIETEFALDMLKKGGFLLSYYPYFLFDSENRSINKFRKNLVNNFQIKFILRIKKSFGNIDTGLTLLENKHPYRDTVLAGDLSSHDLYDFVEAYLDFVSENNFENNYSPPIFSIPIKKLENNFSIPWLNPEFQESLKKIERKGFEVKEMEDICRIIPGSTGPGRFERFEKPGKNLVPYIQIQDVVNNRIDLKKCEYIHKSDIGREKYLEKNDIIFSNTGTIGKVGLVDSQSEGSIASRSFYILRANERIIHPNFLLAVLRSDYVIMQYKQYSTGATIQRIPLSKFKKLKIPILPIKKQNEIINKLTSLEKKLKFLEDERKKIQSDIKSILEDLVD